jgi:hypothetical protein
MQRDAVVMVIVNAPAVMVNSTLVVLGRLTAGRIRLERTHRLAVFAAVAEATTSYHWAHACTTPFDGHRDQLSAMADR